MTHNAPRSDPQPAPDASATATGAASVIHDLGYRHYAGPREGAAGARWALFRQGFRAMFGIGRPIKMKAIPLFVVVVSMLPCLGSIVAAGASNGQVPVRYATLLAPQLVLFVLFMAAQAPEILSRDQQHHLLPLMFTRHVTRGQYALMRGLAVFCAMLCVALAPLVLLWIGEFGVAPDPSRVLGTVGPRIGPVLLVAATTAWVIGGIGAMLASCTARRAYATAAVIGAFLVAAAVATGVRDLTGSSYFVASFIDPLEGIRTIALLVFNEKSRAMELSAPPAVGALVLTEVVLGALGFAGLAWRIRRVAA